MVSRYFCRSVPLSNGQTSVVLGSRVIALSGSWLLKHNSKGSLCLYCFTNLLHQGIKIMSKKYWKYKVVWCSDPNPKKDSLYCHLWQIKASHHTVRIIVLYNCVPSYKLWLVYNSLNMTLHLLRSWTVLVWIFFFKWCRNPLKNDLRLRLLCFYECSVWSDQTCCSCKCPSHTSSCNNFNNTWVWKDLT